MSVFDQAWDLLKMGRVYRGGEEGTYPQHWALSPDVATSYALGGHFGDELRIPQSLLALDDDRLDTDAMNRILSEFYSHGQKRPENLAQSTLNRIEREWGGHPSYGGGGEKGVREVFNRAGRPSPHDLYRLIQSQIEGEQISDRPSALGEDEMRFLQEGPVAMFLEPQKGMRYLSGLDQFMSRNTQHEQKDTGYAGGLDARNVLLDRLGGDDRGMMEQALRDYIALQQGVGGANSMDDKSALLQQLKDAGYEWLAYMDRDPLNSLTLQRLGSTRDGWDYFGDNMQTLWNADPDEMQDDMEEELARCDGHCGKLIPTYYANQADDGSLLCDSCHDELEEEDEW